MYRLAFGVILKPKLSFLNKTLFAFFTKYVHSDIAKK